MLKSKEFEFLNVKIVKVNEKVRNIDRGGCGLFAVRLSKRLTKIGIKNKLVIFDGWGIFHSYLEDINSLGYVDPNQTKPTHVMVKVGNKYIDNNGVFTLSQVNDEYCYCKMFSIDTKHFVKAVNTESGWNSAFPRSKKTISIISSHLDTTVNSLKRFRKKVK